MARANLEELLREADQSKQQVQEEIDTPRAKTPSAKPAAAPAGPIDEAEPITTEPVAAQKTRARKKPEQPASQSTGPLYLDLERKEARLRTGQYLELTAAARRLNRAKRDQGEIITANTLIRVAVDILLEHVDELHGSTEAELRQSVSL